MGGVLVHYGYSAHGGHYVAFIKAPNDKWYLMDDTRSQYIPNINQVLNEKAYLLFYKRNETKIMYQSPTQSPKLKNIQPSEPLDGLQEIKKYLPQKHKQLNASKRSITKTLDALKKKEEKTPFLKKKKKKKKKKK